MSHLSRRVTHIALSALLGVAIVGCSLLLAHRDSTDQPRVLGAVDVAQPPDKQAAKLAQELSESLTHFDQMITGQHMDAARTDLRAAQDYQQQLLSLWSDISATQKTEIANICTSRANNFSADQQLLPENSRMDGMLVASGCQALRGSTK